jgi:signal transduction histidine kinase
MIAQAIASQRPYTAEFRVVRPDGAVRWVAARSKFYCSRRGEAERMVGMAVDITERKMAEEALASLSGRLIDAQEEERKRIARELHDDYNQRIAMLAIDLARMEKDDGGASAAADQSQSLRHLKDRVCELGADLHSLSHRLHPSTLKVLGLVAAVRAFCREFEAQQGVHVDFGHEKVPRDVPEDAELCLFRIAQESLRNVKRHSGAERAEVHLEWLDGRLHLAVSDRGSGFDSNKPAEQRGIGLRSMEERLRVLGGHLEVHSQPMEGTRIDAWLPLQRDGRRAA